MQDSIDWISYGEWDNFDIVSVCISKNNDNVSLPRGDEKIWQDKVKRDNQQMGPTKGSSN